MLELEEARLRIMTALPAPVPETVPVMEAHGRFLLESPAALVDLPPFDNSALDGYAVRAADITSASVEQPVPLRVIGRVEAGSIFSGTVCPGSCVRLFTGAALPAGADSIVMQEDTAVDAIQPDRVWVREGAKPWEGVRLRGEDVRAGDAAGALGERISVGLQSLLAACGIPAVRVGRPPVVSVLATGSELCEPGAPLLPGRIYESNRVALRSLLQLAGANPRVGALVGDSLAETTTALSMALVESDVVITSGGVSVGEADHVKEAFRQLGGKIELWKVAIKPGKPFVFGRCGGKFLFGLPGNPVSAVVTYALLVRPALLRWQGATQTDLPVQIGHLAEPLVNRGDRRHFVRVVLAPDGMVRSAGLQASHALRSLATAHGLVEVAAGDALVEGTSVRVMCLDR